MIEDLRRDDQFVRTCLFDEIMQRTLYRVGRADRRAGQDFVEHIAKMRRDAVQITFHRQLQGFGVAAAQVYKCLLH